MAESHGWIGAETVPASDSVSMMRVCVEQYQLTWIFNDVPCGLAMVKSSTWLPAILIYVFSDGGDDRARLSRGTLLDVPVRCPEPDGGLAAAP